MALSKEQRDICRQLPFYRDKHHEHEKEHTDNQVSVTHIKRPSRF